MTKKDEPCFFYINWQFINVKLIISLLRDTFVMASASSFESKTLASFRKTLENLSETFGRSRVCIDDKSGPRMDPWGTPDRACSTSGQGGVSDSQGGKLLKRNTVIYSIEKKYLPCFLLWVSGFTYFMIKRQTCQCHLLNVCPKSKLMQS